MRLFSSLVFLSLLLLSGGAQTEARTLGPPEPRPAYEPPPKQPDHEIYKRIFELQEGAKWASADRLIRELDDTSLLGHVYRLRYMHPTAYRSKWPELRDWLKKYADHPGAWQVYHLAKKRRPKGARMPKPPPARIYNQTYASSLPIVRTFYKRSTRRIRREVNRLTYRERPTQALRYISKRSVDRQLSAAETDLLRSKIARSYFIEGKPSKALEIAQLATRSRHVVTLSDWHAGLAAWRLNKFNLAVTHFTNLSENEIVDLENIVKQNREAANKAESDYNLLKAEQEQRLELGERNFTSEDQSMPKNLFTDSWAFKFVTTPMKRVLQNPNAPALAKEVILGIAGDSGILLNLHKRGFTLGPSVYQKAAMRDGEWVSVYDDLRSLYGEEYGVGKQTILDYNTGDTALKVGAMITEDTTNVSGVTNKIAARIKAQPAQ